MLLGQVLQQLSDEAIAAETLMGMGDLPLVVEVEAVGRKYGESMPAYAIGAMRRFEAFASDDDWLALMTALGRAADPGAACLRHVLAWSLKRDSEGEERACGCGGTCKGSGA